MYNKLKRTQMLMFLIILSLACVFSLSIGAVAADSSQIYVNPAGNDSWDGQYTTWNGTSGPKLTIKNATSVVGTNGIVYIANGTYNENSIAINRNMNIIGESKSNTIINGTNTAGIFSVSGGVTVTFANLTLTNGNSTAGGAISSNGVNNVIVRNCIFQNNVARGSGGGAIYIYGGGNGNPGYLTVIDSTFTNNRAMGGTSYAGSGGAIFTAFGSYTIKNSNFVSNSATGVAPRGGAIHSQASSGTVQFNRFIGNTATTDSTIYCDTIGGITATLNWWGSNTGPAVGSYTSGRVTVSPWLVLTAPTGITLAPGSNSVIMGDLQHDSNGSYYNPANGHFPDGIPVTFAGDGLGSVSPLSGTTLNGLLITNFTAGATNGVSHPTFTVDSSGAIAGNVNIASVTPTNIVVSPASGNNGNSVNLIATLTNGVTPISGQTVYFYLNGGLLGNATTNLSGIATLPYTIVKDVGVHQILAQFLGNGTYSGSTGTNNLTVNYIPTNLVTNGPVDTNYRDVVNLTATLKNSVGAALNDKMVYFNVNGNFAGAAKTNGAGIATVSYSLTQGAGIYQLLATFLADTAYDGSNATNSFTLITTPTSLTVDPKTGYYNTTVSLTANLTDTVHNIPVSGKTIAFTVNGVSVGNATTAANGIATLSYKPLLGQGIYDIFAEFAGTTGYIGSNGTNNLTIDLIPTAYYFSPNPVYAYYNTTVNLAPRLRDYNYNYLANKTLSFSINGTPIGSVLTNSAGTATIPYITALNPGTYQVLIQFAGDSIYNASSGTFNLTVNYNPTKLNVTAKSGNYNGVVNLTATLKDTPNNVIIGKTVNFSVNGSHVGSAVTDALGVATYQYTIVQGTGIYPIFAQFAGEEGYNASNSTNNLTVSPAQSYLAVNPASGYNGDNTTLTANLWDANPTAVANKPIDFYVNNVWQGVSNTDINGIATWIYNITQSAGVYPGLIKAVFAGDNYYVGVTGFNTLTVIPDTTAPTVNANPTGGLYNSTQNVVLTASEPATIYYTKDDSNPTTSLTRTQYTVPIVISGNTVLKFYAVDTAGNNSTVYTETYIIDTSAPTANANPAGGLYNATQSVVLAANEPVTIYYTTDGSDPTTSSAQYTVPIAISANTVLKFFAVDSAGNLSGIYTENYIINVGSADLRVETVTTSGNTATGITNYPVSGTIKNYGGTVTDTFYVSYYLSTDAIKSSNDWYIGHATINGLASGSVVNAEILGLIPKDIAQGNYYIIAVADVTSLIPESNEANNNKASASSIYVWRPDIRVKAVTTSGNTATGITNYSVTSLVENKGAITSDTFYVSYYLSTDTTKSSNDRYIGHATVNGLNGWSTTNAQFNCTIPKDIAQGNYYIIAVADVTSLIPESYETNNNKASANSIFIWRPDLRVKLITTSGNTVRGKTGYAVTSLVENNGAITSDTFYVSYYLSTDTIKDSNDRYIGHATVNGLDGWSTTNAAANCNMPADIAQGYYYIIAVADSTGLIPESYETNNNKASATRIYIS